MNSIKIFESEGFGQVRVLTIADEPWFVAVDVCRALDIKNGRDALSRLDEDEKMSVVSTDAHSGRRGGAQQYNVGYTVLLCFTLLKTGSLSKSIFAAH